ncbi:hypothetical protein PGTUg99_028916 [Puccinia graminis f. sp. tritici]|uniref:Peptidase A2 domain-containing protein n=1 Tax=Puccinia graminis f. sp. tritici TaxID=56615 RepID=A0A5B0N0I2_PUCGR|nr:hypothetical protein PGTUg99_028916 [Puccinia graminis f. sp. tritici]
MVDSGSMVNVIPRQAAIDLDLEVVEVDIPMKGIGGDRCDIKGVVENCAISIGQFTGPVHLFVSPQAQDCILGRPFLFDYDCTLDYPGSGELLSFQGDSGRRITVPIAKIGQGRGWNQLKNLNSSSFQGPVSTLDGDNDLNGSPESAKRDRSTDPDGSLLRDSDSDNGKADSQQH